MMQNNEQLCAHGAEARHILAVVQLCAANVCRSGLRADLAAMDEARGRLETAIGSMRVMAIASLKEQIADVSTSTAILTVPPRVTR